MKLLLILCGLLLLLFLVSLFSTSQELSVLEEAPIIINYLPKIDSANQVINRLGYSFEYSEEHEQSKWVAYLLTKRMVLGDVSRTNRFMEDPLVITGTATNKDYSKSGFDRGHLAPAADMSWSIDAMQESFYYSNMSPQNPSFNRGIWKKLEEQVRQWALEYDSLLVITGPVLVGEFPKIGDNEVSVPKMYYKVIARYGYFDKGGIAFLIPNIGSGLPIETFALTIDSLETVSNIDFFAQLPVQVQELLEGNICLPCWSWKVNNKTQRRKSK